MKLRKTNYIKNLIDEKIKELEGKKNYNIEMIDYYEKEIKDKTNKIKDHRDNISKLDLQIKELKEAIL